jgi:hypothetical protein
MKPSAGAVLISRRTEDHPDLELCIAAARPAQKVADRNASQQSEPVLLDDVLTMPTLRGPVLSKPTHASQIKRFRYLLLILSRARDSESFGLR